MAITKEQKEKFETAMTGRLYEEKPPKNGCLSLVLAIIVFACLM